MSYAQFKRAARTEGFRVEALGYLYDPGTGTSYGALFDARTLRMRCRDSLARAIRRRAEDRARRSVEGR